MNDPRLLAFKKLLDIMDELREKCPWDSKQTFESLRYLTIEETYELSDAIIDQKYQEIGKEMGDLMLHLVFYSKIGEEKKLFDIETVLNGINEKLVRRHPHIFGDVAVQNETEVKENWEKIKLQEKGIVPYWVAFQNHCCHGESVQCRKKLRVGRLGYTEQVLIKCTKNTLN